MDRIGSDVRRELDRYGGSPEGLDALVAAWPTAVGPDISANAWPARLARDGALVVHARDAVWAFELTLRGEEIRGRLGVSQVRFEVGVLPDEPLRKPPEPSTQRVLRATPDELATAASWASAVDDSELRDLVARAAAASLASARSDRSF